MTPKRTSKHVGTPKTAAVGKTRTGVTRVRFLTAVAGPDMAYTPGQVYDMPEDEAEKWCDGERAERA